LHFGQYLTFIGDTGLGENDALYTDIAAYDKKCETLLKSIGDAGSAITAKSVTDAVASFERDISGDDRFHSHAVYRRFFDDYPFFVSCAFGFITVKDDTYFGSDPGPSWKPLPQPFDLTAILGDAIRIYPVVSRSGNELRMAAFGTGWADAFELYSYYTFPQTPGRTGPTQESNDLRLLSHSAEWRSLTDGLKLHRGDGGFKYCCPLPSDTEPLRVLTGWRWYLVGLDDVGADYKGRIRGLPMLRHLPFESLLPSSDGDE
jgi:hypothetical protein